MDSEIKTEGVKVCRYCKQEKPLSEFHHWKNSPDGFHFCCKECKKKQNQRRIEKTGKDVLSKRAAISKAIKRQIDPEYDALCRQRARLNAKSESYKRANIKYRQTHKEQIAVKELERIDSNVNNRLIKRLRNRVHRHLTKGYNDYHTIDLLGCSIDEFKQHLESQFKDGMSWDNYGGKDGWAVDHIVPIRWFDLTNEKEILICFNYRNCQPMWSKENGSKNDRLPKNYLFIVEQINKEVNGSYELSILREFSKHNKNVFSKDSIDLCYTRACRRGRRIL